MGTTNPTAIDHKSKIGDIYCMDEWGEALAWSVYCVRADKYRHADHTALRKRARQDMLAAGWTESELDNMEQCALHAGTHGVERKMEARGGKIRDIFRTRDHM